MELKGLAGKAKVWQRVAPASFSMDPTSDESSSVPGEAFVFDRSWGLGSSPAGLGQATAQRFAFAWLFLCEAQRIDVAERDKYCGRQFGCKFHQVPLTST